MKLRFARAADVPVILTLIKHLAEYEKLSHQVIATEESLHATLFGDKPYAEVILSEHEGKVMGMALFFHNYSTFIAKPGIYLEDLCVLEEYRGQGVGEALLKELARIAIERGCGFMEWAVLDWNEDAIRFYEAKGAELKKDWVPTRLVGEALVKLSES